MNRYWLYGDRYEDLDKELENKALYGMTAFDFDPYTTYMSDEEMNSFSDSINGSYVGIGVEYSDMNGNALILRVFKSSPAEKAGLQEGDIITEFDGNTVTTKVKLETAVNSHESGYMADITVQREVDGEYQTLTVTITLNGPSK